MWNSINQIVGFVSGLVGIVSAVVGIYVWYSRKKRNLEMDSKKHVLANRIITFGMVTVVIGGLVFASPGYVSVSITGGKEGDIKVEQSGFGPQSVKIDSDAGLIHSQTH